MEDRFNIIKTWGNPDGQSDGGYDYPTMEDSDEAIEAFVEQQRSEYYQAWHSYVKDFD